MVQARRRVARAATGVVLAGALVGSVGVAGAFGERAADQRITVLSSTEWDKKAVSVETGDTVTWSWQNASLPHNARGEAGPDTDPEWLKQDSGIGSSGELVYTFVKPGEYRFICDVHPQTMTGTVTVTGEPIEATPTPIRTPTPTRTPTPVPTTRPGGTATPAPAPGMADRDTPAPRGAVRADTVAPAITGLKAKARTRGAKVSFKLSESAAVTLRVKRAKRTVKTVRGSYRAGSGSVTLRRMARGTYRVEIEARDARGNRAAVQRKTVKVTR